MGFRQVAPGLLVSDRVQISIAHPDPCWVIHDKGDKVHGTTSGKLLIFSAEALLRTYLDAVQIPQESTVPTNYTWDELVDKFGAWCSEGIIDHAGQPGFYKHVPLRKGI